MPFVDIFKSKVKTICLTLVVAGIAVTVSSLMMALTVDPGDGFNLYAIESALLGSGMVMVCMGIMLFQNAEGIFGDKIREDSRRMHDKVHEQIMAEMRLSDKDLMIQKALKESGEDLYEPKK